MNSENISIETSEGAEGSETSHQVTITDRKASRAWSGEGASVAEAATQATRKFLDDRRAREYIG